TCAGEALFRREQRETRNCKKKARGFCPRAPEALPVRLKDDLRYKLHVAASAREYCWFQEVGIAASCKVVGWICERIGSSQCREDTDVACNRVVRMVKCVEHFYPQLQVRGLGEMRIFEH